MNTIELVMKIKEETQRANVNILEYIDVEDIEEGMLCIDGEWMCRPAVWGICFKNGSWVYFSTDEERGYISGIKKFSSEEEVCDYTYNYMHNKIKAKKDGYSHNDMAVRYMMKKYDYTEDRARQTVEKIGAQEDIFEEMFCYMRRSKFVENSIKIEGITAEKLVKEKGFTVVGAYRFLVELREHPEEAKELLKNGTVEKE